MKKEEVLKYAITYAKKYKNNLEGKNILFVFEEKNTKEIKFVETMYKAYNYLHLTGLDYCPISSNKMSKYQKAMEFYKLATIGKLDVKNVVIKNPAIIDLKMQALNTLIDIDKSAKMIGDYNNIIKDALYTEKISGNVHYCLGFVKDRHSSYYIPNTTLSENILNVTNVANRIIAIFKKLENVSLYGEVTYLARGIELMKLFDDMDIENRIDTDLVIYKNKPKLPNK